MDASPRPTSFGNYRLVGLINTGGMAELYLALQEGMEGFTKIVAVKRILPHLAQNAEFIKMFLDEARLAARLEHPNIGRIYNLGETDGSYFMAMEYLPGEDLSRTLEQAGRGGVGVAPEMAALIIQAVADGLHYAHDLKDADGKPLGVIHRDVNPANIIVSYQGAVKVVDFGIAKARSNNAESQTGAIKGKLSYLSPEQARGEVIDRRSDIFCLGIVMWELLTYRRLFKRPHEAATISAILHGDYPSPQKFRPDIPEALERVVMKALAMDPAERYQTASEMSDGLEEYLAHISARPSAKALATWLERVFGEERAQVKRSIAEGRNLDASISRVVKLVTPAGGSLRSVLTTPSNPGAARQARADSTPSTRAPTAPKAVSRVAVLGFVALAAALGTGAKLASAALTRPSSTTAAPAEWGTLTVESEPSEAFIFIGGEPTGLVTPAVLRGISTAKPAELRLEKAGYAPTRQAVQVNSKHETAVKITLAAHQAHVSFVAARASSRVIVDGVSHALGETLTLTPGNHELKLMDGAKVLETRTVTLKTGDQSVKFNH
jgi:serine/threonine protein kinase